MTHNSSVFFLAQTLNILDKNVSQSANITIFGAPVKLTKLLMYFMKKQVIFPSKFALILSIMTANSSVFF